MKSLIIFAVPALLEIAGCFSSWVWGPPERLRTFAHAVADAITVQSQQAICDMPAGLSTLQRDVTPF
jgi:drug/metabolite transporter superfamily protein YnfA